MPVRGNILYCPICAHPQSQINLVICERCSCDLGAPNVNIVSTEDELNALKLRYEEAKDFTKKNSTEVALNRFESHFNANVKAVINISLKTLLNWVLNTSSYKTYHRAVDEGLRKVADLNNDRKRTAIDSLFYGTHGRDIYYAALTLNSQGLESYGHCRVILDENLIENRASTLEENSFNFVKTHKINFEKLDIPNGYRSTWGDKLKLTVAKLHLRLTSSSSENDFDNLVLKNARDRNNDEFIEIHIYNYLSSYVIKSVFIPKPKNDKDKIDVMAIEGKLSTKVNIY